MAESPSASLPVRHERAEHALLLWRTGRRLARRALASPEGARYARAMTASLARLQRYTTMDALVAAYERTASQSRSAPDPERISQGVVEDASYWLRLRQIIEERR